MILKWSMIADSIFEELVCDPNHVDSFTNKLPEPEIVECKSCSIGQERDVDGNCYYCPAGTYQPTDFRAESDLNNRANKNTYDHLEWLLDRHKIFDD